MVDFCLDLGHEPQNFSRGLPPRRPRWPAPSAERGKSKTRVRRTRAQQRAGPCSRCLQLGENSTSLTVPFNAWTAARASGLHNHPNHTQPAMVQCTSEHPALCLAGCQSTHRARSAAHKHGAGWAFAVCVYTRTMRAFLARSSRACCCATGYSAHGAKLISALATTGYEYTYTCTMPRAHALRCYSYGHSLQEL